MTKDFRDLASRYPATATGLRALMADKKFCRLFPEARMVDARTVDFGDGTEVDVLHAHPNETPALVWPGRCAYCRTTSEPGVNCRNCGAP